MQQIFCSCDFFLRPAGLQKNVEPRILIFKQNFSCQNKAIFTESGLSECQESWWGPVPKSLFIHYGYPVNGLLDSVLLASFLKSYFESTPMK